MLEEELEEEEEEEEEEEDDDDDDDDDDNDDDDDESPLAPSLEEEDDEEDEEDAEDSLSPSEELASASAEAWADELVPEETLVSAEEEAVVSPLLAEAEAEESASASPEVDDSLLVLVEDEEPDSLGAAEELVELGAAEELVPEAVPSFKNEVTNPERALLDAAAAEAEGELPVTYFVTMAVCASVTTLTAPLVGEADDSSLVAVTMGEYVLPLPSTVTVWYTYSTATALLWW